MAFNQTGDRDRAEFHGPYTTDNDYNAYHDPSMLNWLIKTPLRSPVSEPHIDIVAQLKPVIEAAYDCGPRADSRCFEGTRVEV